DTRPPAVSTPLPYTTLFRSSRSRALGVPPVDHHSIRGVTRLLDLFDAAKPWVGLLRNHEPCLGACVRWRSCCHPPCMARQTARRSEEHTSALQSREKLVCRL